MGFCGGEVAIGGRGVGMGDGCWDRGLELRMRRRIVEKSMDVGG